MMNIVDIIESVYPRCKNLDFTYPEEVGMVLGVLGLLRIDRLRERIYDPVFGGDDPDLSFVDYAAKIFEVSKGDIKRLIKGQGIRINNEVPGIDLKVRDIPWLVLDDWLVGIIRKGKNEFEFILA